ncbi:hypothetical protein Tco_0180648 [Tanacetum coccineum]
MASQDDRLSKFEDDFKQQQGEMTSKIDIVLKVINDQITGALPSDTIKNPKLNVNPTSPVLSAVVKFTYGTNEIAYKMPHKIKQYNSLSDLEKDHPKSVYFRNEEDKKRGVMHMMNKIFRFYKECLELEPEYLTGLEDEGGVTKWLVPSCCVIFDLEPLSLSFDFVFCSEIFKSLSFSLDRLYHLAILCLDQHAHTLHHLESLLTISLDRLDILEEDLVYQSLWKSLYLILKLFLFLNLDANSMSL